MADAGGGDDCPVLEESAPSEVEDGGVEDLPGDVDLKRANELEGVDS